MKFQPCWVILGNVRGHLLRTAVLGTEGPCRSRAAVPGGSEGISWGPVPLSDLSLGPGSSGCTNKHPDEGWQNIVAGVNSSNLG